MFQDSESENKKKFKRVCDQVSEWPDGCPDNAEWDLLLKAGKEVFCKKGNVHSALELVYIRQAMLRPIVDLLANAFSDQFCNKYK